MSDDDQFDDEPITDDQELTAFEKHLFAAIRDSRLLDTEIDDEYRRLANGDYDEPAVPERGSNDQEEP